MSILVQQFKLSDVLAFQPLSSSITKRNWEFRKAFTFTFTTCSQKGGNSHMTISNCDQLLFTLVF